jgi:hypothetical protein
MCSTLYHTVRRNGRRGYTHNCSIGPINFESFLRAHLLFIFGCGFAKASNLLKKMLHLYSLTPNGLSLMEKVLKRSILSR